jgi:predicted dehydrogenase
MLAAAVLAPHDLADPITMEALRAGRYVLLVKPFVLTFAEADVRIADEVQLV